MHIYLIGTLHFENAVIYLFIHVCHLFRQSDCISKLIILPDSFSKAASLNGLTSRYLFRKDGFASESTSREQVRAPVVRLSQQEVGIQMII